MRSGQRWLGWMSVVVLAPALALAETTERTLSDREMADSAELKVKAMHDLAAMVLAKVEAAKVEKDVAKVTCIMDSSGQIKQLVVLADSAMEELLQSLKDKQSEAVAHEYQKITIAEGKVGKENEKVGQCVGLAGYLDKDKLVIVVTEQNNDSKKLDPTPTTGITIVIISNEKPPASPVGVGG